MRFRTTLLLVGIAVGLGAFVLILDRQNPSRRSRETSSIFVVNFDRQLVQDVTIQNGDVQVELKHQESGWTMQKPLLDRADGTLVDQLLEAVQFLHREEELTDLGKGEQRKRRLRDFGLLKPRVRLKLETPHDHYELFFGNDTAVEGTSYLRVAGRDAVYVVAGNVKTLVSQRPNDYRDHRLTPFLTSQIDQVKLGLPGGLMELQRIRDEWEMRRPVRARASNERVNELLTKFNSATILDFVDQNRDTLAEMGEPALKIALASGQEQTEVTFGPESAPGRQRIAISGRPNLFLVNDDLSRSIDLHPDDLRDRRLTRFNPDLVDRIVISNGSETFTLARQEDQWRFADDLRPVNGEAVQRFLADLRTQEVTTFVADSVGELARYGLDQPSRKITLSAFASENTAESPAGEAPLLTLLLGRSQNGFTYVRLAEEPFVVSVPDTALARWPKTSIEFQGLDLLDLRRQDLAAVTLHRPGRPDVHLTRSPHGQWLRDEGAASADDPRVQAFLNAVVGLRAVAWAGPTDPAQGLSNPVLSVTLQPQDPALGREEEIKVGSPSGRAGYFCSTTHLPGTSIISSRDFAELKEGLDGAF
ncbi:MAG TPA: DUF4340 domain-containing protein [Chthoniobacterales bacterium]